MSDFSGPIPQGGGITINNPKYTCPAHGVTEHAINVTGVRPDLDGDYCIVCWLLLLERSGVYRMKRNGN
jgi:hypothetical protein